MGTPEARRAKKEAAVFAAQLAALEQEYTRSPALLKMLGREF
jgi:hypothetical protein